MEFTSIVEILVLMAIAIEVYALYGHSKLSNRIDEHILDVDRNLERSEKTVEDLDDNISKVDERMIKLDEHIHGLIDKMNGLDEHVLKLDGHMNKVDDFIWNSYFQRNQNNDLTRLRSRYLEEK
jgi:chromosome segregation ATPase